MALTALKVQTLIGLVITTQPDQVSCDECYKQIGEYAERSLEEWGLPDGMPAIQRHLEQCHCCMAEFQLLLSALNEIEHAE